MRIGLIGDYDPSVTAHQAIPRALELAAAEIGRSAEGVWIPTDAISAGADVSQFDALWCVPASPYRSMEGALTAIRFAREQQRVFLGTCGGFQHVIIEFARSVLGWSDAEHEETSANAARAVISELSCALVEATDTVSFSAGTRIATAYGTPNSMEGYRCRYGLNNTFREALTRGPLRVSAVGGANDVRAVELDGHPFFVATLFQPERAALMGTTPPLVRAFLTAAATLRS